MVALYGNIVILSQKPLIILWCQEGVNKSSGAKEVFNKSSGAKEGVNKSSGAKEVFNKSSGAKEGVNKSSGAKEGDAWHVHPPVWYFQLFALQM